MRENESKVRVREKVSEKRERERGWGSGVVHQIVFSHIIAKLDLCGDNQFPICF